MITAQHEQQQRQAEELAQRLAVEHRNELATLRQQFEQRLLERNDPAEVQQLRRYKLGLLRFSKFHSRISLC